MNRTHLAAYCLSRKGASVEQPFGPEADVYKVMGKMFALIPTDGSLTISLKCDPVFAVILRDTYPAVTAAYHFNKSTGMAFPLTALFLTTKSRNGSITPMS